MTTTTEPTVSFAALRDIKEAVATCTINHVPYDYSHSYNRGYGYGGHGSNLDRYNQERKVKGWALKSVDAPCVALKEAEKKFGFPAHVSVRWLSLTYDGGAASYLLLLDYDRQTYYSVQRTPEDGKTFQTLLDSVEELQIVFGSGKNSRYDYNYGYSYGNNDFKGPHTAFTMEVDGVRFPVVARFSIAEQVCDLKVNGDNTFTIGNAKASLEPLWNRYGYKASSTFGFTLEAMHALQTTACLTNAKAEAFLRIMADSGRAASPLTTPGVKKLYDKLAPLAEELRKLDPKAYCVYRSIAEHSGKSVNAVKTSVVFNATFGEVTTAEGLQKALRKMMTFDDKENPPQHVEGYIANAPCYKEKRKAVIKSQSHRALTKIMEDVESLTIDPAKHKRTYAAIEAGELPIGTFFRKSEQYHLLNDTWDLWEEMFKRGYGPQAIELANEVKGRTTYEKDLMSYFYFVLHALPKYLKKQTGEKWKCIPRLVNTQDELEPPKEGDDGVARKRSALTPTVDNDAKTVEVPYASLAIWGGRGTTYCYSHDYHVLETGYSLNGYVVMKDAEEKLNGRDDYGLMFYTLTGSAQGRGYPTFLIIFERRESKGDVRVHFHRTHPSRSKDGDYAPITHWTKTCYNWMAGNVRADRIKAQQGDLVFVQVKVADGQNEELDGVKLKDLAFDFKVNNYDSHTFEEPVQFAEYKKAAKSNVLGYVRLEQDCWLRHPEHDDVLIPSGDYAIHQCRSWEANPQGVWSLRID